MVNDSGYRWGLNRGSRWALAVLAGVYEVRSQEPIRRAVHHLFDSIDEDTHVSGDRSVNIGLRGVIRWHQVTGEQRARQLILDLTDRYLAQGHSREGLMLAAIWPGSSNHTTPGQGFANLEALVYCYDLAGDRRYIHAGVGHLTQAVEWLLGPLYGKGLILWMRILRGPFRFMAIAHELGIGEKVPGAGTWLYE